MFELILEFCSFRTLLVIIATCGVIVLGAQVLDWSLQTTLIAAGLTFVVGMAWSWRKR